ncbi:MAG TPA: hypothetical protein VMI11_15795 [Actinomycetes bacterium]|nr:hypothetical protein [Actinomycetes bacterium]
MSSWAYTLALLGLLVVVVLLYVRSLAGRLDRLHVRLEAAESALDAQLIRRSAAAAELAYSGVLDPASSLLLADAAHEAQVASGADLARREPVESALSSALRAAVDEVDVAAVDGSPQAELLDELRSACQRVQLARRFANDAARATLRLRRRPLVRRLGLAGHAPWPRVFEIDDAPPPALG